MREIAGQLGWPSSTVKTHVSRILVKLGLRDRTQAAVFGFESGLVTPGSRAGGDCHVQVTSARRTSRGDEGQVGGG